MNLMYKLFKRLKLYSENKMQENYLKPNGGCDSCCPKCKQWESLGNEIATHSSPRSDFDTRVCGTCNHAWEALFTPAGFIPKSDINITSGSEQ